MIERAGQPGGAHRGWSGDPAPPAEASRVPPRDDDPPLAALIDELHQHWDAGENVATQKVMHCIRELIRGQWATLTMDDADLVGDDDDEPAAGKIDDGTGDRISRRNDHMPGQEVDQEAGQKLDQRTAAEQSDGINETVLEYVQIVARDTDYWAQRGVQLLSVGSRFDGCGVVVGVRNLTQQIMTAIRDHYSFPIICWEVRDN